MYFSGFLNEWLIFYEFILRANMWHTADRVKQQIVVLNRVSEKRGKEREKEGKKNSISLAEQDYFAGNWL